MLLLFLAIVAIAAIEFTAHAPHRSVDHGPAVEHLVVGRLPNVGVDATPALDAAWAALEEASWIGLGEEGASRQADPVGRVWFDAAVPRAEERVDADLAREFRTHRPAADATFGAFFAGDGPDHVARLVAGDHVGPLFGASHFAPYPPLRAWRLSRIQRLAWLLGIDAARRMDLGDAGGAVRSLEATIAIGRMVAARPSTIEYLTGSSITMMSAEYIDAHLSRGDPCTREVLDALATTFAGALADHDRPPIPDAVHLAEGLRLELLDVVQQCYTDGGIGGGRFVPSAFTAVTRVTPEQSYFFGPRRDRVVAAIDAHTERLAKIARLPRSERLAIAPIGIAPEHVEAMGPIADLILTPHDTVLGLADRTHVQFACTALRVALARHHDDHGDFPPTLAGLVPVYLDEVPENRWSGVGWNYRVDPEMPAGYALDVRGGDHWVHADLPSPAE